MVIVSQLKSQTFRTIVEKLKSDHGVSRQPSRRTLLENILFEMARKFAPKQTAARIVNKLGVEFTDWNELRVSSTDEISEAIGRYGYSSQLAQAIQEMLQTCFDEFHDLELSIAEDSSVEKVKSALGKLNLSTATAGSALLDWAPEEDLPVTTDISRVMQRLGFVEDHFSPAAVRRRLEELCPPEERYAVYRLLHEHGAHVCVSRGFDCSICVLHVICPRGRLELAKRRRKSA